MYLCDHLYEQKKRAAAAMQRALQLDKRNVHALVGSAILALEQIDTVSSNIFTD